MSTSDVPFGFIKGTDLILSAWGDHKDRKIGEVKDDGPDAAVKYFQQKFQELETKISELSTIIETSENKGSYLMKLLHLKETLPNHDGLGDYSAILEVLVKNEEVIGDIIQGNRERNAEIKSALLDELKEVLEIINWKEATEKIQDIKERWIKTGNAKEEVNDQLETDFWDGVQGFFDKKKFFYEDKNRLIEVRKKSYEDLIVATDQLPLLKGKDRFDKVKELKATWGEVGNVPSGLYKDLMYRFNSRLKGQKELPPPDFEGIGSVLDAMYFRSKPIDKDQLQQFRKNLASFRTKEKELKDTRHDLMERINLIWERDFLENLAGKKNRNFHQLEDASQAVILTKLLKEFIVRDRQDLVQYEENSEKFAGHDQKTNRMLERKLGQQRNKIVVKEKLLKIIEETAKSSS
ncbi:MAG: DUF349 domain-containing protein [Cytophagales bacterium]|nr:DUF349 domain-containing protein [Cytophagales bacterium]